MDTLNTRSERVTFTASDGVNISVCQWLPQSPAKAVVLIAHGAAEHAARYKRVAQVLNQSAYAVFAIDHRGHGHTAQQTGLGIFAEADGWNRIVRDLFELTEHIRQHYPSPKCPLILIGHSMGSLMAQQYIGQYGDSIDAAVLSGTTLISSMAALIPALEQELKTLGRNTPSAVMAGLFEQLNMAFENTATAYDWLSRDHKEVQAYINDPLCGFDMSTGAWLEALAQHQIPQQSDQFAQIPVNLPIYLFAGDKDPINQNLELIHQLTAQYKTAGMQQICTRYYRDGRHEMLNEINHADVTEDLLNWLDTAVENTNQ